jgi:hypothetical protein
VLKTVLYFGLAFFICAVLVIYDLLGILFEKILVKIKKIIGG